MAIKDLTKVNVHLFICNGGSCKQKGADECTGIIRSVLEEFGFSESVFTTRTLCNGRCNDGPIIISQPYGIWFKQITVDKARDFVKCYIVKGEVPLANRLYVYGEESINSV